ncbi:G5P family DNA-binding protein [Stenotrophomonas indicatrix]|uniref:G5P family DNA-binding protein n=1 Tax=Stenotrophomonas indicatrix TaxID=2045451 RepID=UPI001CBB646A|nr:G5P family DNA-binding protein [Stenotrophomonas indicatrix]
MSIKVTVLKSEIDERGGNFKNDKGESVAYTTRKQKGKLETDGFAYPFDVRLQDGQPGYPQGDYELDIESMLQVNKGVASLSKFTVLRKLPAASAPAATPAAK